MTAGMLTSLSPEPFWGAMINAAGAGPAPLPGRNLTTESLTAALKTLVAPQTLAAAQKMGNAIQSEDGVHAGVDSFLKHLPVSPSSTLVQPANYVYSSWKCDAICCQTCWRSGSLRSCA